MRIAVPLALLALTGCAHGGAGLDRPANAAYRIPGRAPDPLPFSAEEGAQAYALAPGPGVGYDLDAAITGGEVRVTLVLRNEGHAPLRYDLRRLALTGARGEALALAALQEDPSRRVTREDRAREDYRLGVREVRPGERDVVTRRYRLADADAGDAWRALGALELDDEVAAGDRAVPVKLHLERAR